MFLWSPRRSIRWCPVCGWTRTNKSKTTRERWDDVVAWVACRWCVARVGNVRQPCSDDSS